jgi:hypothetical protein
MEDLPVKKVSMEQMTASESGQALPSRTPAAAPAAVEKTSGTAKEARRTEPVKPSFSELLNRLEDPTRITKIEKINTGNGRLTIEVKDSDGRTLRSFDVTLHPETRKVNIILDVKN